MSANRITERPAMSRTLNGVRLERVPTPIVYTRMPSLAAAAAAASGSTAPVLDTPSERRITILDFRSASFTRAIAVARPSPMAVIVSSWSMGRPFAS